MRNGWFGTLSTNQSEGRTVASRLEARTTLRKFVRITIEIHDRFRSRIPCDKRAVTLSNMGTG